VLGSVLAGESAAHPDRLATEAATSRAPHARRWLMGRLCRNHIAIAQVSSHASSTSSLPTMQQTPGRSAATTVAAVLGVLLLVVLGSWAASVGPSGLFRGDGIEPARGFTPPPKRDPTATGPVEVAKVPAAANNDWGWLRTVAVILELALLGLALYVLYRGGKWAGDTWSSRRRPDPPPAEVEFDVLEDPAALVDEIVRDAARQRDLLDEGTPRNGIVRCWREFEVSAARVGLARKPWQTPAEYTMLILDLVEAEHGAVARLADRYREARFSEHEVTEADRADALAALDQIHADLSSRSGVRR
jgi:hypothetical protein